jgi:cell wall-associated NlpC family hydrolase
VNESRSWIGTQWENNQRVKAIGVDCTGLLIGIGINVGFLPSNFTIDNYHRIARGRSLLSVLERYLAPVARKELAIADIIAFDHLNTITHVGIVSGENLFIHAHHRHGVIEQEFSDRLRAAVCAIYEIPGVING